MDLKIKDVADLLSVSETTIRRWLAEGKIPAYRINQQYLFSRSEIENWVMMSRKPGSEGEERLFEINHAHEKGPEPDSAPSGSQQFSLFRAIHRGGIISNIPGTAKEEVIREATHRIAKKMDLDGEGLTDLLLDRERLQPTALNHGVGIPHTRDFLLNSHYDVVTIAFPEHPIAYGALDGEPVHTLFFLFACDDKRHLHLLAKIAHFTSLPANWALLKSRPSQEALLEHVKNWEGSLHIHKS